MSIRSNYPNLSLSGSSSPESTRRNNKDDGELVSSVISIVVNGLGVGRKDEALVVAKLMLQDMQVFMNTVTSVFSYMTGRVINNEHNQIGEHNDDLFSEFVDVEASVIKSRMLAGGNCLAVTGKSPVDVIRSRGGSVVLNRHGIHMTVSTKDGEVAFNAKDYYDLINRVIAKVPELNKWCDKVYTKGKSDAANTLSKKYIQSLVENGVPIRVGVKKGNYGSNIVKVEIFGVVKSSSTNGNVEEKKLSLMSKVLFALLGSPTSLGEEGGMMNLNGVVMTTLKSTSKEKRTIGTIGASKSKTVVTPNFINK